MLAFLIYPATVGLAVALYAASLGSTVTPPLAAVGAVVAGALAIAAFELRLTYHTTWKPRRVDLAQDALYTAVIQIVLPRILALAVVLALAGSVGPSAPLADLWPRHWPIAAQALLVVLSADFMRYWLHRAAHTLPTLWRLHAVHHSPDRLYWLNTSRFHPLEKTLHFSLDALPFLLLGVDAQVLGFWFVIYSVNGFFQHCNIRLRFGVLSAVFSTAELHRWHHSRVPAESNSNYANVFILWDRLFGTYFRPTDRQVGELGLINRRYPMGFGAQLRTPFVSGLDRRERPLPGMADSLLKLRLHLRMLWVDYGLWRPLQAAARDPRRVQEAVLRDILRANRESRYGREHRFAEIDSYAAFTQRVPVAGFEALRPYVEAQRADGGPHLTAEAPVAFVATSGTTAEPKHVPLLEQELKRQRRHMSLLVHAHYADDPEAFDGEVLALAGPAEEGRFADRVPWGSTSGLLYAAMPPEVAARSVVPAAVFELEDAELKYLLVLRLALARRFVTYVSAANPTTLLKLCSMASARQEELLRDIREGGFCCAGRLPAPLAASLERRFAADPARAAQLEAMLRPGAPTRIADIWPDLRLVATWTGGNCAVAVDALRPLLPAATRIVELGYLASEFRGTLPLPGGGAASLPTLDEHFFEFVEPAAWDAGRPEFRLLHELEQDRHYYVVVTTPSGLYRYFINDIVRAEGRLGATPTLRFLQKGKGVTNITGEKLYESQAVAALQQVERELGFNTAFFVFLADTPAQQYRLYLEPGSSVAATDVAARVDAALRAMNMEYGAKRDSGRLHGLAATLLAPGTGEAYRRHCIAAGQREGQFKVVALQYASQTHFPFDAHLAERGA